MKVYCYNRKCKFGSDTNACVVKYHHAWAACRGCARNCCLTCGGELTIAADFDDDPDTMTDEEGDDEDSIWRQQNDPVR